MCGIAGLIDWRAAASGDALRAAGEAVNETLRHRDDSGVWAEAESGVVLGQRRLAIIDLSPGGAQPMHSADRRYVITFNGEIYNYRDMRNELAAAGRTMRSDSDTEVLLEACALSRSVSVRHPGANTTTNARPSEPSIWSPKALQARHPRIYN